MIDEEKTTDNPSEAEQESNNSGSQNDKKESINFDEIKKIILMIDKWEEIADIKMLKLTFKTTALTQTEKTCLVSLLAEKAKKLKMHTEFKKLVASVKKEAAKDREYLRSTYNTISCYYWFKGFKCVGLGKIPAAGNS